MFEARFEYFARISFEYSTRVRPVDRVAIRGFPRSEAATPLINAVGEDVLKAGGYPHVFMTPPDYLEPLLSNANEGQLRYINPLAQLVLVSFDVEMRTDSEIRLDRDLIYANGKLQ